MSAPKVLGAATNFGRARCVRQLFTRPPRSEFLTGGQPRGGDPLRYRQPDGVALPLPHGHGLFLSRDLARLGLDAGTYARAAHRGHLVRVRHGAYLGADEWRELSERDQYLMRLRAVEESTGSRVTFCGPSAAAVWGMPIAGAWPTTVHVIAPPASGGRSKQGVVRHTVADRTGEPVAHGGFLVTDVARTAIDVALCSRFSDAVGSVDWALWRRNPHRTSRDAMLIELQRLAPVRFRKHAQTVIAFATDLSDSFGESHARAVMFELGSAAPELQVTFRDEQGEMVPDYYWRGPNVAGEFDGKQKYLKPNFDSHLEPGERLWREKLRQDRLRKQVADVVRIVASDVMNPRRLIALLEGAGVPRSR